MVSQGGPLDQGNYRPPSKVEKVHHLFLPKPNKDQQSIVKIYIYVRLRGPPVHRLHPTVSRMGPRHENDPQCRSQVDLTFSISAILFLDVHHCHPQTRVAEEKASPTPTGISINNSVFFLINRPKWIVLVVSTKVALAVLMALLESEGV